MASEILRAFQRHLIGICQEMNSHSPMETILGREKADWSSPAKINRRESGSSSTDQIRVHGVHGGTRDVRKKVINSAITSLIYLVTDVPLFSLFSPLFSLKKGIFPPEFGKALTRLVKHRDIGDYSYVWTLEPEQVMEDVQKAEQILSAIRRHLEVDQDSG